jgi:hypothetical protein
MTGLLVWHATPLQHCFPALCYKTNIRLYTKSHPKHQEYCALLLYMRVVWPGGRLFCVKAQISSVDAASSGAASPGTWHLATAAGAPAQLLLHLASCPITAAALSQR